MGDTVRACGNHARCVGQGVSVLACAHDDVLGPYVGGDVVQEAVQEQVGW